MMNLDQSKLKKNILVATASDFPELGLHVPCSSFVPCVWCLANQDRHSFPRTGLFIGLDTICSAR